MFYAEDRKYFKDSPYKDRIDAKASLPAAPPKQKRKAEGQAESWVAAGARLTRYPDSKLGELILQLVQSEALIDVRNRLFADTYGDAVHIGKTKKVSYVAGSITINDDIYSKIFSISFNCERPICTDDIPLSVDIPYEANATLPVAQVQAVILQMLPGLE